MDGILLVDKPRDITSYKVVDRIKKHFKLKKVGHGGTLDPFATGLLVILIGKATKSSSQFLNNNKSYDGVILLGKETDTYDVTGKIITQKDARSVDEKELRAVFNIFSGPLKQRPPLFSAIKVNGQKAYNLARKGKTVELAERDVNIFDLTLREFSNEQFPKALFSCHVSKGTYIRSLAHDIGQKLEVGAYLEDLRRTAVGDFSINDAQGLDNVLEWDSKMLEKNLLPF